MSRVPKAMPSRLQKYLLSTKQKRQCKEEPVAIQAEEDTTLSDCIISYYDDCETHIHVHNFHETVSDCIRFSNNFFEIQFLDFLRKHFPKQDGIIDIGANIGNHTLFFAKFLNPKTIYSFEPVDVNFKILTKNVENYKDKCICYKIALSNQNGTLPLFNSQKENYGGFSLHSYSNGSSFLVSDSVDVKTLDSFHFENITLIKIDVENHENEVLEGAKDTIIRNKPLVLLENLYYNHPNVCSDPNPHETIMTELGYVKKYSNIENSLMDLWISEN
jgi:FkbM family methyltransferase